MSDFFDEDESKEFLLKKCIRLIYKMAKVPRFNLCIRIARG